MLIEGDFMIDWQRRDFSVKNNSLIIIFVIITALIILIPTIIRSVHQNESLIGEQSYFHLGLAQNIGLENKISTH